MSIVVEHVSKRFWLRDAAPRTFQQAVAQTLRAVRRGTPFWALRDVSFRVEPGQAYGIIGHNGAGKSTLLRLICGLGRATAGRVQVDGRVAALLELGVGFHPHLTGRENLLVSGVVAGLRRAEVAARFDEIVAFAEMEEFIDQPLRIYSAGMQVRLAFAVAIHVDPEVLIIDEALSAGDAQFQQKCIARIEQFRRHGKTLLFVSHEMPMIQHFCDRAIWLNHGQIVGQGPAAEVIAAYEATMLPAADQAAPDIAAC